MDALRKVQRSITDDTELEMSLFLKTYMLGIVSNLNEMLQDVHGKKSFPAKKQILRGLEALIVQIGPLVNEVSPQARPFIMFSRRYITFADHGYPANYVSGPRTC